MDVVHLAFSAEFFLGGFILMYNSVGSGGTCTYVVSNTRWRARKSLSKANNQIYTTIILWR